MAPLIEGSHTGEHVMQEAAGTRSREYITIGPSQTIVPGMILGLIVSSEVLFMLLTIVTLGMWLMATIRHATVGMGAGRPAHQGSGA